MSPYSFIRKGDDAAGLVIQVLSVDGKLFKAPVLSSYDSSSPETAELDLAVLLPIAGSYGY